MTDIQHHVQVTARSTDDFAAALYLDCPCGWSHQWDDEEGSTTVPYATVRAKVDAHLAAAQTPPAVQVHLYPDSPAVAEAIRDVRRFGPPPVPRRSP